LYFGKNCDILYIYLKLFYIIFKGGFSSKPTFVFVKRDDNDLGKIEETVMPLALSAAKQLGAEVYDIEYKKEGKDYYLRIFIDKDGGVGINDCENYSRLISPMLDSEDPIKDNYILEVSSPGMFRKLNTEKHFEKYIGSRVEVKLYKSENGKKSVTGTLKGYANGTVTVLTDDAGEKEIEKEKYMYVRLYPDIF